MSACNTESITSFSTRKYSPGYFADSPGAKPEISRIKSATIAKKTCRSTGIEKSEVASFANNECTVASNHIDVSASTVLISKPIFTEKVITPPVYRSITSIKDTVDQGLKDQRHKRLGEVGLFVLSAGLLVIGFTFVATSGLLYGLFVLLSIGTTIIAYLINESMPRSSIMQVILCLLACLDLIGFGLLLLEGHQD